MNEIIGKYNWDLGLFASSVSQLTPEETISLLSKTGYRWVEWRVQTREAIENSPWGRAYNTLAIDDLADEAAPLASFLKKEGIGVCGLQVDVPADFPDADRIVLDASQRMGCSRVLLTGPSYDPSVGLRAQHTEFKKTISSWVKSAEDTGIKICLENHMWTIIPSTALLVALLEDFDASQVGVLWDPANGFWEGYEIPEMALDLMGGFLEEVHLKNGIWSRQEDGSWAFNWCDITDGLVNWSKTLTLLSQVNYQGPLVVEDYRQSEPEEKLVNGQEGYLSVLKSIN